MAFVHVHVHGTASSLPFSSSKSLCFRHAPHTPLTITTITPTTSLALRTTRHGPRMTATPPQQQNDEMPPDSTNSNIDDAAKSKPKTANPGTEDDDEGPSVWGVASFGIIFAIFMIGIVATLARDFIPGGVTAPVP